MCGVLDDEMAELAGLCSNMMRYGNEEPVERLVLCHEGPRAQGVMRMMANMMSQIVAAVWMTLTAGEVFRQWRICTCLGLHLSSSHFERSDPGVAADSSADQGSISVPAE